ncbi:MAG: ABC transporter permease subunit [Pseudomonadota bacterium]
MEKPASWSLRSRTLRGWLWQAALLALLVVCGWWLARNLQANMAARGIQGGYDFLWQSAGFDIGEGLLPYNATLGYWRAFLAGLANTLKVALPGVLLATLIGTLVGVARLSRNALLRGLGTAYVETFRNLPLLLQLLLWYLLLTELLPAIENAWQAGPFWLSKGGLHFPVLIWGTGGNWEWQMPAKGAFSIEGGGAFSPEFLALLLGLVLYTAAFVAEVVRAGLQSVPVGQHEAAYTLGLSRGQTLRRITLPLALRVVVPPLTNQYLNLTKNSSLAVAIGYPDLVSIANTAINQTGRAVECISIVMLVYLATSLLTAGVMQRVNARMAIRER